jgi:hypothetical protein
MRLHTNILTPKTIHGQHVVFETRLKVEGPFGSRSHRHAYEITLRGIGPHHRKNAQNTSDNSISEKAATYDEWGKFIADLFRADPDAKIGPYNDRTDFRAKTNGKY